MCLDIQQIPVGWIIMKITTVLGTSDGENTENESVDEEVDWETQPDNVINVVIDVANSISTFFTQGTLFWCTWKEKHIYLANR